MATLTYRMEILSPLHIGSGQEYSAFDGVFLNGRWYLIDLEKVIEQSKEDPTNLANAMMQRDFSWAGWLQRRNINPEQVARHSTPCLQNPGNTAHSGPAYPHQVYSLFCVNGQLLHLLLKGCLRVNATPYLMQI